MLFNNDEVWHGPTAPIRGNVYEVEWEIAMKKLIKGRLRLSNEDTDIILQIANKL